nr:hypothetical protein [bacterium]
MEEIITYNNYEEYKNTVNRVLNKTVEDFVTIGYLLKKGRDTDILKESGYANVNEFAEAEYHLDASQVSRFIRINDKFAVNGYSDRLKEEYRGYGYAKLAIMLTLPDELTEELSPALSKTEIQAVKAEVEEEGKTTDIEVFLEGTKKEQEELDDVGKGLNQLFKDEPELFLQLYGQAKKGMDLKAMQEILAPNGEKVYSIRIQGHGRIMLIMKDTENEITVFKVRSNEKERYDWNNVKHYVDTLISEKTAKERWEELYQETFPEKEGIAPVQQTKQRKESKVKRAKVPEKVEEEIAPVQQTEETQSKEQGEEEQIEGQINVTDYPELMPERTEHIQTQTADEIITRKEYLDNLTEYGAAEYLCKHLKPEALENKETMEEWLKAEVDKKWGMEVEQA